MSGGEGVAGVTQAAGVNLLTLAEMRALVYGALRDDERAFVDTWFVDKMLNEAYLDLNARLRLKQKTATGTTSATGTIAYPTDCVEAISLWIEGSEIKFVDNATFRSWQEPGTATPYVDIARVFNQVIETYPVLDLEDYEFEYVARPDLMITDGDQPVAIHRELQPRLVHYAKAHGKWQEGEEAEGNRYMAMYEEGLPGAPRMQYNIRPASVNLLPEPGPFDA